MLIKLTSAAILFICFAIVGYSQNEIYHFKTNPNNIITPILPKSLKPLPYTEFYKKAADTARFSHHVIALGDVYNAPQDGMPILKPTMQQLQYEQNRTMILKPYAVEPFGKPSVIEPMPNPIKRALIFEEISK